MSKKEPYKINQKVAIQKKYYSLPYFPDMVNLTFKPMIIEKVIDKREELGGVSYQTVDESDFRRIVPHYLLTDNEKDFFDFKMLNK